MIGAERINLLPGFVAARKRTRRILQTSSVVASAFAVACAVTYLSQGFALRDARSELDVQLATNVAISAQVAQLAELQTLKTSLDAQQAALTQLFADEIRWSRVLADLQSVMPGSTWLTGMTISQSNSETGVAQISFQGTTTSHMGTAFWLKRLSRVPAFTDAYFSVSSKQGTGAQEMVSFSSTVTVTAEAYRANQPGADRTLQLRTAGVVE